MGSKKRKSDKNGASDITTPNIRALLEPFSKEQLLEILEEASAEHPDILDQIRELADKDVAHRKLFVRGLASDTSADTLKNVFSQYGEIEDHLIVFDKSSGKSKGYGFVTFSHLDAASRALKEPSKKIDGRMSVCQLASAGPSFPSQPSRGNHSRKIYVGNLPHDVSAEKLLALFSEYGEIEEGPLGFDKQTGKSRGFALFIYKSLDSAKRAVEKSVKTIDGHQITCKPALEGPKEKGGFSGQDSQASINPISGLTGLLPFGQGVLSQHSLNSALAAQGLLSSLNPTSGLAGLNPSLYSSIAHQMALNSSLNSSLNPPLPASFSLYQGASQGPSQAYGQVPSSVDLASYGLGAYGSQAGGLEGLGAVGASLYGLPASSMGLQSGILPGTGGHYSQLGQGSGARGSSLSSFFTD